MTKEEMIEHMQFIKSIAPISIFHIDTDVLDAVIEALKFAQWVADEIMDEELWELNYGAFSEIACRKLEKLGIVKSNNGYWELVEPQESEEV